MGASPDYFFGLLSGADDSRASFQGLKAASSYELLYMRNKKEEHSEIALTGQNFSASNAKGRLTVTGGRDTLNAQNTIRPGYIRDSFSLPSAYAGISWRLDLDKIKVNASCRNSSGAGGGRISLPENYLSGDTQADKYFFSLIGKAAGFEIPLSEYREGTSAEIRAAFSPFPAIEIHAGAEGEDKRLKGSYSYINSFTDNDFPQGSLYSGVKMERLSMYVRRLRACAGIEFKNRGVRIGLTVGKNSLESGAASELSNPAKSGVTLDILNNLIAGASFENLYGLLSVSRGNLSISFHYSDNKGFGNFNAATPVMGKVFFVPIVHRLTGSATGRLYAGALSARYAGNLSERLSVDFFNELWRLDCIYDGSVKYSLYGISKANLNAGGRLTRYVNRLLLQADYSLTWKLSLNLAFQQYIPFSLEKTQAGGLPEPGAAVQESIYGGGIISAGLAYRY